MADMQALKSAVDELSPQELDELYRHLERAPPTIMVDSAGGKYAVA
ncbi:MAG: hypothetical protein U0528_18170 [Anaerolineae bacterium]